MDKNHRFLFKTIERSAFFPNYGHFILTVRTCLCVKHQNLLLLKTCPRSNMKRLVQMKTCLVRYMLYRGLVLFVTFCTEDLSCSLHFVQRTCLCLINVSWLEMRTFLVCYVMNRTCLWNSFQMLVQERDFLFVTCCEMDVCFVLFLFWRHLSWIVENENISNFVWR